MGMKKRLLKTYAQYTAKFSGVQDASYNDFVNNNYHPPKFNNEVNFEKIKQLLKDAHDLISSGENPPDVNEYEIIYAISENYMCSDEGYTAEDMTYYVSYNISQYISHIKSNDIGFSNL
jgi:hypothetical protein